MFSSWVWFISTFYQLEKELFLWIFLTTKCIHHQAVLFSIFVRNCQFMVIANCHNNNASSLDIVSRLFARVSPKQNFTSIQLIINTSDAVRSFTRQNNDHDSLVAMYNYKHAILQVTQVMEWWRPLCSIRFAADQNMMMATHWDCETARVYPVRHNATVRVKVLHHWQPTGSWMLFTLFLSEAYHIA